MDGVDVDFAFQITPRWSMAGGFSYADGRIRDDFIPCNDGNFDGVADTIQPTFADSVAAWPFMLNGKNCLASRKAGKTICIELKLRCLYFSRVLLVVLFRSVDR